MAIDKVFFAEENRRARHRLFLVCACGEIGSRSQSRGSDLGISSRSQFEGGVTKLASGASFAASQGESCVIDFN